jgi:chromosome segregation protein
MQIKELNIKNFKSFDYVKIPLGKGLHVVVGPNGSGKSNITDALLFGLGTTSLKRLRVDKLSDLINHNTKAKTARVRIVIEYENQDYEIVREIDASGKSVFLLNNQRKSLNEITSFLKEIGMDVEGYNVIQQGDVLRIINLKPEERRTIIDDLSGISLFDARKKEAEDNLKKVDEKLQKVNIALNERKPYIEQLRSEKENALKYQELDSQEKLFTYNFLKKQISIYNSEIEQEQENVEKNKQAISDLIKQKREALDNQKILEDKIEEINYIGNVFAIR